MVFCFVSAPLTDYAADIMSYGHTASTAATTSSSSTATGSSVSKSRNPVMRAVSARDKGHRGGPPAKFGGLIRPQMQTRRVAIKLDSDEDYPSELDDLMEKQNQTLGKKHRKPARSVSPPIGKDDIEKADSETSSRHFSDDEITEKSCVAKLQKLVGSNETTSKESEIDVNETSEDESSESEAELAPLEPSWRSKKEATKAARATEPRRKTSSAVAAKGKLVDLDRKQ